MKHQKFWKHQRSIVASLVLAGCVAPGIAWGCSSCGCNLSTDWATQGLAGDTGWRMDFCYDYFNQTQLRTGTGKVDRAGIPFPASQEIQQGTANRVSNVLSITVRAMISA